MTPKLKRVIRLDSTPLVQASLTEEGYLMDRPILTTVGIFEYRNDDGSIRRELRLPEEVFDLESLASYKGKPIIITHDAGLVDKDNVAQEGIGTILTEGYRDGDNVRAEIVIQDTNAQKDCGLKELSLGYNLDLDETPGEWHGEHYDAIQRNIRVNHLALVRLARAGDQARLNIDGRDNKTLKGGNKSMAKPKKAAKRADGATLNPEDFQKAIDAYKARRAERMQQKDSETETAAAPAAEDTTVAQDTAATKETETPEAPAVAKDSEAVETPAEKAQEAVAEEKPTEAPKTTEEKLQLVKDRRDRRDSFGDPEDTQSANGIIAEQDDDIDILLGIIEEMLAKKDFDSCEGQENCDEGEEKPEEKTEEKPEEEPNADADDTKEPEKTEEPAEPDKEDSAEDKSNAMNLDAKDIDALVNEKVNLILLARKMNLDGVESMSSIDAKKAIIKAVRPAMRLDGKSASYVNAAFDFARSEIEAEKKDINYQRKQMMRKDSAEPAKPCRSAAEARKEMINKRNKEEM